IFAGGSSTLKMTLFQVVALLLTASIGLQYSEAIPGEWKCTTRSGPTRDRENYQSINVNCPNMKNSMNECCSTAVNCTLPQNMDKKWCNREHRKCFDNLLDRGGLEECLKLSVDLVAWEVGATVNTPESLKEYAKPIDELKKECKQAIDVIDSSTRAFDDCVRKEKTEQANNRACEKVFSEAIKAVVNERERSSTCYYALGYLEAVLGNAPTRVHKKNDPAEWEWVKHEKEREHRLRYIFYYMVGATAVILLLCGCVVCCKIYPRRKVEPVHRERTCSRRSSVKNGSHIESTESVTNSTIVSSPSSLSESTME
ncbi:hypothetical protein PFISCL1PPCAC_18943, partial [Pristionchus fissidentatus]